MSASVMVPYIRMQVTLASEFYTDDNVIRPRWPMDVEEAVAVHGIENVHILNASPEEEDVAQAMGEAEVLREVSDEIRQERRKYRIIEKNMRFAAVFGRTMGRI